MEEDKKENGYFDFSELFKYYFRKNDSENKPSINTRMMHGINKISIVMFLIAAAIIIFRFISRAI